MRVCERSKWQLRNSIFIKNGADVGSPIHEDVLQLISQSKIALSDAHRNCEGKGQTWWVDFRFNRSNSKVVAHFSGEVSRKRSPYNREVHFLVSHRPNN